MEKLWLMGILEDLLELLGDYLRGRALRTVVNGQTSQEYPMGASVLQGPVLGLIHWNIFINDLLQQRPQL
ncbi:hypothetical protein Hamer_G013622 [Homarus americanus]|uniref:Reverse transcriptase n=1 Tax=Homarus americanus TaxID=6706 RepID=A0A8J5MX57_HOMAM|nr:hypothetical protein Hamer_G013622 [Homarus americanus]